MVDRSVHAVSRMIFIPIKADKVMGVSDSAFLFLLVVDFAHNVFLNESCTIWKLY